NGLSHTFIGDVGMLSIGPSGSSTIMLYSTGLSGNVSNANYTFDDAGGAFPNSGASGTYRPTTSGVVPNLPAGAPAGPSGRALFRHNGGSANGTWSLYLEDHGPGDFGSVANGWTITLLTPKRPSGTSVGSNLNPSNTGDPVTFTATVTDST